MAIAISHSNGLVYMILTIFPAVRTGSFLLVEATVCCRFYYWSETSCFNKNHHAEHLH